MENTENREQELKESLELKGIGSELQTLKFPRINNLRDMLKAIGYSLTKIIKN